MAEETPPQDPCKDLHKGLDQKCITKLTGIASKNPPIRCIDKCLQEFKEFITRVELEQDRSATKWWEIVFRESIKVYVSSPSHQLEIQRIRTNRIQVSCKDGNHHLYLRHVFNSQDLFDADWAIITPKLVFAPQHLDWIDFERSAIRMPEINVPIKNIAAIF